jgi:hypothetical protein
VGYLLQPSRQPGIPKLRGQEAVRAGTLGAGQVGLGAVTAVVALTQLAAARRFAGLTHRY